MSFVDFSLNEIEVNSLESDAVYVLIKDLIWKDLWTVIIFFIFQIRMMIS